MVKSQVIKDIVLVNTKFGSDINYYKSCYKVTMFAARQTK